MSEYYYYKQDSYCYLESCNKEDATLFYEITDEDRNMLAIRDLEQQANAIESVRKHNVRMKRKFSSQWSAGHVIENLQIEERNLREQAKQLKGGE